MFFQIQNKMLKQTVTFVLISVGLSVVGVSSKTCLEPETDASLLKLLLQENVDGETLNSLQSNNCNPEAPPIVMLSQMPISTAQQSPSILPSYPNCGKSPSSMSKHIKIRIAGGSNAGLGTYPWMAMIGYSYRKSNEIQYGCGGTLINENYILTAAHCVTELPQGYAPTTVRLGEYNTSSRVDCEGNICAPRPQNIPVLESIPHENYSKTGRKENDIALIRLQKSAVLGDFVSPVCLPQGTNRVQNLTTFSLMVAGWGRTKESNPDNYPVLQMVQVPFQPRERCRKDYGQYLDPDLGVGRFCAGGEIGKDSCKGDSGGPLMTDSTKRNPAIVQQGVVSLGPPICDESKVPGLYTNVSHYISWILSNISK